MEYYDISISYKRKSLVTANNLHYRISYEVIFAFLDSKGMRKGNFDIQHLNYIKNAKDAFVTLEKGVLNACKRVDWKKGRSVAKLHFYQRRKLYKQ